MARNGQSPVSYVRRLTTFGFLGLLLRIPSGPQGDRKSSGLALFFALSKSEVRKPGPTGHASQLVPAALSFVNRYFQFGRRLWASDPY